MRNDTDIRKEAYRRILKRELCWWLVAIAGGLLLAGVFSGSGIVNLFLHGFQGIGSCWAGIICLVVTGYIAYSLLGILREKRKLIGHGIQAEAVVTAIQKEIDVEEGGEAFVAVYEFTLPGGRKWKVKEQLNGSQAGLLGLIEVGSRVPVFVDRDHPYKFYLYTHLLVRQFYEEDKTFVNSLEKLKRQGTNVGNIGEAILRHQERGQRVFRSRRKWRWLPSAIVAFVMVLVTAFGYIIYNRFEAYVLVSDLNLPPGFSYYNAYATELHEYLPGNNRWSYTDEDGYEDWTSSWRFTDKCKRPMFVVWGTQGLTHTRTTSMLMIPESYRDRLDEFIYDMNADLKPKLQKLLKGFAPRTGLCILSPVLKDTMQIEGGGYWPLLTLGGACATAAAEIRLKASGVNPDTLRVDKTTMFYYATIEAVSDRDTLATDAVTRIAGGVERFGVLYASVGIQGFRLTSARSTPLNQATPFAMASLLGRLMRYKDHLFRELPDIYETQDYLELTLKDKRWITYYTLACAEAGGRRVLNVFALVGDHLLVIFMEGADVSEETLMKKAGELMLVAKDNLP